MSETPNNRRWYQFSLRTLLVVVTVLAILCGWFGVKYQKVQRQKRAVEAIHRLGGVVVYDTESGANVPVWLREALGVGFFCDMIEVDLMTTNGFNPATDDDLEHLEEMSQIQALDLRSSDVSDAGMGRIANFGHLQSLFLDGTHVTDTGLSRIEDLTQLRTLSLGTTCVSDVGLAHLKRLPQLAYLDLNYTRVTDAGLADLKAMPRLEWLGLQGTAVSDQGVADLRHALPGCDITQ